MTLSNTLLRCLLCIGLTAVLSGCFDRIESTSYDPDATLSAASGETLLFSVKGPAIDESRRYKWLTKVRNYDGYVEKEVQEKGLEATSFQYVVSSDLDDAAFIEVYCELQVIDWAEGEIEYNDDGTVSAWKTIDTIVWEVKKPQTKLGDVITSSVVIINRNDLDELADVSRVEGDLVVETVAFGDLGFLDGIVHVGGRLIISNVDHITRLDELGLALESESLAGLSVVDNHELLGISGLANLQQVHGLLDVSRNWKMVDLNGLSTVTKAGEVLIKYDSDLQNLYGLHRLATVDGELVIGGLGIKDLHGLEGLLSAQKIIVYFCHDLQNLVGLTGLQSLGGLTVHANRAFQSFEGFNLSTISGDLEMNYSMGPNVSFHGLENLRHIGGDLSLYYTDNIKDFEGLNNLQSVDGFVRIERTRDLASFVGLDSLEVIGNGLLVLQNTGLLSLDGFETLRETGGVSLSYNTALMSVDGIANIAAMGWFTLGGSEDLTELSGFNAVQSLEKLHLANTGVKAITGFNQLDTIEESLEFHYNDNLNSLAGLSSLQSAGSVKLVKNYALPNLQGLESLQHINGLFQIWEDQAMVSLQGLENLKSVAGPLVLADNLALESVSELVSLERVDEDVAVRFNRQLCESGVQQLIDQVAAAGGIGGSVTSIANKDC